MHQLERDTVKTFDLMLRAYTCDRNIKAFIGYLDKDVAWLGIGKSELFNGLEETEKYLLSQDDIQYKKLKVIENDTETRIISDKICTLYGNLKFVAENSDNPDGAVVRITSVFERNSDDNIKLKRLHLSLPYADFRENEYLPQALRENSVFILKRLLDNQKALLDVQNEGLKTLTEYLPGGLLRCRDDEEMTLEQYSDGFLTLLGYTKQEIKDYFNGSLRQMIYPPDRPRVMAETSMQHNNVSYKSMEYRMLRKDGSIIWVLDKGRYIPPAAGKTYGSFYCIILDVTNEKKAERELSQSLERHRIIMEQSHDIIFEWVLKSDELELSSTWQSKFGFLPVTEKISQTIDKNNYIYREDLKHFKGLKKYVAEKKTFPSFEFRIFNIKNETVWCKVSATVLCDEFGNAARVIGVIEDIDKQKKNTQALVERAEKDALTGLYNKVTFQTLAEHAIKNAPDSLNALLIIDIDNFKDVNDTKGHLFGDAVLSDIASELKKRTDKNMTVGRIGGDEFSVFLENIPDYDYAEQKAVNILELFEEIRNSAGDGLKLSCSIGIAVTPLGGSDYNSLFANADIALYKAKCMGKDRFVTYDRELAEDKTFTISEYAAAKVVKEPKQTAAAPDNSLFSYVFRALYKSENIQTAIQLILEIIGRQFDVSRTYIFENSEDKKFFSNTFEWCKEGISAEKDSRQNMKLDNYDDYYGNFDENGIFYCRDVDELPQSQKEVLQAQNVKSLLQCAIYDCGEIVGMVGFDECNQKRYWTKEQIDALTIVSEIVSTFLLKQRTHEKLQDALERTTKLLDNQNSYVYAVDAKTFKLLYFNKKTQKIAPDTRLGQACHYAFFDSDKQCENCPVRQLRESGDGQMEIYNKKLKIWTAAEAVEIAWSGMSAYLLTCHDLTKYKK